MSTTPAQEAIQVSDTAWKCLEGAYDLQIHVGPDVIPRRIDDISVMPASSIELRPKHSR